MGKVTDSVECLIRDLVADDKNKNPTSTSTTPSSFSLLLSLLFWF